MCKTLRHHHITATRAIHRLRCCLAMLLYLGTHAAMAQSGHNVILDIQFIGNEKTQTHIMEQELLIKRGDPIDQKKINESKQSIMNLGLFKSVKYTVDNQVVTFYVKEKGYFLAWPEVRQKENDQFTYGGYLSLNNLRGKNQKFKFKYKTQEASEAEGGLDQSFSARYTYPRVGGTAFQLNTEIRRSQENLDIVDITGDSNYDRNTTVLDVSTSRLLKDNGPSQGWSAGTGISYTHRQFVRQSGTPGLFSNGKAVAISLNSVLDMLNDHLYSNSGMEFSYRVDFGTEALGSDRNYTVQEISYKHFQPLALRHENFNLRLRAGISSRSIFVNEDNFDLAGSRKMRGYESGDITGNSYFMANFDYLRPIFNKNYLRSLVSMDLGNAYKGDRDIDLGHLKSSLGIGLYIKINWFVDLELRTNLAYAIDEDRTKFYLFIENNF